MMDGQMCLSSLMMLLNGLEATTPTRHSFSKEGVDYLCEKETMEKVIEIYKERLFWYLLNEANRGYWIFLNSRE